MSLLNFHPKYRPIASVLMLALCSSPAIVHAHRWQSANDEQKAATERAEQSISLSSEQAARDERIALKRAERCILIDERFPMVEGGNVYYDPTKRDSKRLLPAGTMLCSARSGFTAIVDEAGTVSSLKQAPIEKIHQVLKQRGLL